MNNPSAISLVSTLWGPVPSALNLHDKDLKPFLAYYRRQLNHPSLTTGLHTLCDLSQITDLIAADTPRDTILTTLQSSHPTSTPSSLSDTLDLVARLLVFLPFGDWDVPTKTPNHPTWAPSSPLRATLPSLFPCPPSSRDPTLTFPPTFDAFSLESHAGIAIIFTDNLADHLRLVAVRAIDKDVQTQQAVLVFHHATALEAMVAAGSKALLPAGLAAETLRTLALLFPQGEFTSTSKLSTSKKAKWLKHVVIDRWEDAAGGGRAVDGRIARCEALGEEERRVEGFWFWRERLVVLKRAFELGVTAGKGKGRGGLDWGRAVGGSPAPVMSGF